MALATLSVQLTGLMSCICRMMLATIGRTVEQWHTQPMRQLPYEPGCWDTPYEPGCWDTPYEPGYWDTPYELGCWHAPYVDIPVPQIVEEIAEVSKSLIVCNSIVNLYFEEIEVFLT